MLFVGNYYEKTGSTITKYYYAAATRIAVRTGSTLTYLLGDHLGSTSIVTNSSGALLMETRYKPFGEVRYATTGQTLPTKYTFTGQYSYVSDEATDAAGFGLMFFNARFYDPWLGRFSSADTDVPAGQGVQAYDRYAFVNNNPVRYIDPSGHAFCQGYEGSCTGGGNGSGRPPMGDLATPWDVGLEWLTGLGPRHHEFYDGDPFTELLQAHEYLDLVRRSIKERLQAGNYSPDEMDYYLGGVQGVPKYAKDYSTLLTFGQTGNLAVTYLGSYELDYYVVHVDPVAKTAEILFHVTNESTLASATHPPVIGYTKFWEQNVSPIVNGMVATGPMSTVTQSFWWTETLDFR
jgi:RHS repeat-associated protein